MKSRQLKFEEVPGCVLVGVDPGPVHSAIVCISYQNRAATLLAAKYPANRVLAQLTDFWTCVELPALPSDRPTFLCYESCANKGVVAGAETYETAAIGGEIRRALRPFVDGTYVFNPSDWRYHLTGQGNAKTALIYAECCRFFQPSGGGSDPYRGTKGKPGPLADLYKAGAGGNMEHMKDALGVALALTRVRFRAAQDPEYFRRPW
jgi:hypothetical protein